MIKKIDITNPEVSKEVLNIQISLYKAEAEIIDYYDIPPLKDTFQSLQQCGETFFGDITPKIIKGFGGITYNVEYKEDVKIVIELARNASAKTVKEPHGMQILA